MKIDFDLDFLKSAIDLVDASLEQLEAKGKSSPEPDTFGVFDEIEYIIGFGFVACQTYTTATVGRSASKRKKSEVLALGPKHRSGRPIVQLINAAANHWKHSAEWTPLKPTNQEKQTVEVIRSLGVDPSEPYPIANMLHAMLTPNPILFKNLIPYLIQWRDSLPK